MGTDIHGVVQVRYPSQGNSGKWIDKMQIEDSRNYFVFAVLANVRNGEGFAGIPTPVIPIQDKRGLPKDFRIVRDSDFALVHIEYGARKAMTDEKNGKMIELDPFYISEYGDILTTTWMGDHSYGWITLEEWYNWPYWRQYVSHQGIVSRAEYVDWLNKQGGEGAPSSYCGGIAGPGVKVWDGQGDDPGDWTHRIITWKTTAADNCSVFWAFMEYLDAKYGEWPGRSNVRLVFGFDS